MTRIPWTFSKDHHASYRRIYGCTFINVMVGLLLNDLVALDLPEGICE